MCQSCYDDYIAEFGPPQATPAAVAAAETVKAVYAEPGGGAGGALHIVIDDLNLEDHSLARCGEHLKTDAERACHAALTALTIPERVAAMAISEGQLRLIA